jgi:hypothetical protein
MTGQIQKSDHLHTHTRINQVPVQHMNKTLLLQGRPACIVAQDFHPHRGGAPTVNLVLMLEQIHPRMATPIIQITRTQDTQQSRPILETIVHAGCLCFYSRRFPCIHIPTTGHANLQQILHLAQTILSNQQGRMLNDGVESGGTSGRSAGRGSLDDGQTDGGDVHVQNIGNSTQTCQTLLHLLPCPIQRTSLS